MLPEIMRGKRRRASSMALLEANKDSLVNGLDGVRL